jgi:hypothetical protein
MFVVRNNIKTIITALCAKYRIDRYELSLVLGRLFEERWKFGEYQRNLHLRPRDFAVVMALRKPELVRRYLNQLIIWGAIAEKWSISTKSGWYATYSHAVLNDTYTAGIGAT